MGLLILVLLLPRARGWPGVANAAVVCLEGAAMGAMGGAALGAFLGWIAGPILRETVSHLDARSFGAHRLREQGPPDTEEPQFGPRPKTPL
jgi:hypothetical protein